MTDILTRFCLFFFFMMVNPICSSSSLGPQLHNSVLKLLTLKAYLHNISIPCTHKSEKPRAQMISKKKLTLLPPSFSPLFWLDSQFCCEDTGLTRRLVSSGVHCDPELSFFFQSAHSCQPCRLILTFFLRKNICVMFMDSVIPSPG